MFSTAGLLIMGWLVVALLMLVLWVVQRIRRNAGIVDVAWAFGTGLLGVFYSLGAASGYPERRYLIAFLAAVWGARLGFYLVSRVLREEEDGRYRELREKWGDRAQFYLFLFFQVQALGAVLGALPMWAAAGNPEPRLVWTDWLGVLIWAVSITGESLSDSQLSRFRKDPSNRGKVCRQGLWRYSRHPNYFFEWLHWWAYVAIGVGSSLWWVTVSGPVIMLVFLFKVTGIPPTEERALKSRGEAYRRYQETTSVFFPWPPRRNSEERQG